MTKTLAFGFRWLNKRDYPTRYFNDLADKLDQVSLTSHFVTGFVKKKDTLAVVVLNPLVPFPPLVIVGFFVLLNLASPWLWADIIAVIGAALSLCLWLVTSSFYWSYMLRWGLKKNGAKKPDLALSAPEVLSEVLQ